MNAVFHLCGSSYLNSEIHSSRDDTLLYHVSTDGDGNVTTIQMAPYDSPASGAIHWTTSQIEVRGKVYQIGDLRLFGGMLSKYVDLALPRCRLLYDISLAPRTGNGQSIHTR
jgi:hypothetical protein